MVAKLQLDASPLSLAARIVAVVAGHTPQTLALGSGALSLDGVTGFAALNALAARSQDGPLKLAGASAAEEAQIADWAAILEKDASPAPSAAFLERLDRHLLSSAFLPLSAYRPTVVDYVAWCLIVSGGAGAGGAFDQQKLPNLARWARTVVASIPRTGSAADAFLQGTPLAGAQPELPQLPPSNIFTAAAALAAEAKVRGAAAQPAAAAAPAAKDAKKGDAAPKDGKKADDKKKPAAAAAAPAAGAAPVAAAAASDAKDGAAKAPKEKKEKKEKPAAASSAPAAAVPQVYRVDFRVGKIMSVAPHPTEARMLVEQIDVGESVGGVRTVVSGLAEHFSPADLTGRVCIVMVNCAVGDIKGVESRGRVMVATDAATGKKELATPPEGAKVGEQITFASVPASSKPDQPLAPKRLHEILKGLHTNADKVVQYQDTDFMTTAGPVTVPTVANGVVA